MTSRSSEIYLDNATVARPSERTISAMMPYFSDFWGSAASPHQKGQELFPAIEIAYKKIYQLFGGDEKDTFVMTSSGAEAVNQIIDSAYQMITLTSGKNQFITSNIDDAPQILSVGKLETLNCVGKMAEVNQNSLLTAEIVGDLVTPRTALISISWAHGLTGVIQPVAEISDLCKERGILFHLDVTHALGKLYFELDDLGADLITFNGAPLHAPKGTGGIYVCGGVSLSPMILGGSEQGGFRAGEFDIPQFIGLGEAVQELIESRDYVCTEIARLRDKFEREIHSQIPDVCIFFQEQERLPNCSTIAFPGIPNELMLYSLNRQGIYANIGGGLFQQIGRILQSSGIDNELANTAVSFSLSRLTTEESIERAIEIIIQTVRKLKKVSFELCL